MHFGQAPLSSGPHPPGHGARRRCPRPRGVHAASCGRARCPRSVSGAGGRCCQPRGGRGWPVCQRGRWRPPLGVAAQGAQHTAGSREEGYPRGCASLKTIFALSPIPGMLFLGLETLPPPAHTGRRGQITRITGSLCRRVACGTRMVGPAHARGAVVLLLALLSSSTRQTAAAQSRTAPEEGGCRAGPPSRPLSKTESPILI